MPSPFWSQREVVENDSVHSNKEKNLLEEESKTRIKRQKINPVIN